MYRRLSPRHTRKIIKCDLSFLHSFICARKHQILLNNHIRPSSPNARKVDMMHLSPPALPASLQSSMKCREMICWFEMCQSQSPPYPPVNRMLDRQPRGETIRSTLWRCERRQIRCVEDRRLKIPARKQAARLSFRSGRLSKGIVYQYRISMCRNCKEMLWEEDRDGVEWCGVKVFSHRNRRGYGPGA